MNTLTIPLAGIPLLPYARFHARASRRLQDEHTHCAHYFGADCIFYCILLDDETNSAEVLAWKEYKTNDTAYPSLTAQYPALHPFERGITEQFGVKFTDNPYDKPLRFAHDRADRGLTMENYPFYTIDSPALHEVNVGPIHAGVIEPGAFRFICNGEQILHMEVVLGYQHRGVERLMSETRNRLRQCTLAESVAGDTAVSHAWAHAAVIESLADISRNKQREHERTVAQELERLAVHLGDTGALCMDVAFQLGQAACEALRTIVINTTQRWCGNRFGKSLIRPGGTHYPLTPELSALIVDNVKEVRRRYTEVCEDLFTTPSVLGRFEECGKVARAQMQQIGAVGPAARASSLPRDIRRSHPYGAWAELFPHEPVVQESGDVLARARMRYGEAIQSIETILRIIQEKPAGKPSRPVMDAPLTPSCLAISFVEGWRGEICHAAITDAAGHIAHYRIKDPSLHNWYALSLAVRGEGISDFPVNNKSFNLSYCGYDL